VPMRTTATFDTLGLVLGATVEIVQTIRGFTRAARAQDRAAAIRDVI